MPTNTWVEVPNLQNLMPGDMRWNWYNSNKVHNKCNCMNHPKTIPPTLTVGKLSSTKPVPGGKRVGNYCSKWLGHRVLIGRNRWIGLGKLIGVRKGWGFPHSLVGKESTCNAGGLGSIPESRRSPGEGNGSPSSILTWRIPWTEEPGRLQSMASQELDMT